LGAETFGQHRARETGTHNQIVKSFRHWLTP
jgi:hypothetical protein